ncbi:MAG: CPBP family intramembrane glutamic endopeptidase [Chloroflexota bacterium]|nr:CPBP family intramembrane glutamic endopeptidase [Chloroflexota bacterium]
METGATLLPFVILAIIMVLANLETYNQAFRWITYIAIILLNLSLLLFGLLGIAAPSLSVPGMNETTLAAFVVFARAMGIASVVAFFPLLRPVRSLLARFIPIDPDSTVHTTALVFAVYLLGMGLGQIPLMSDPAALEGFGPIGVTTALIWAQAVGMILLTFAGIGTLIRRDWRESMERLAIKPVDLRQLGIAMGAILLLLAVQFALSYGWQAIDPEGFQQIEDAGNLLLGDVNGLFGAITIGLAAALGEELIFRGALQPKFGLILTAILFTVLHSQYGISPATVLILAIALLLGVMRTRTNLTVCILIHFGYNFLGVMLSSLGP